MVDDDDGLRTPDHGHPISSPCEPNGSGELKMQFLKDGVQTVDCIFFFFFAIDLLTLKFFIQKQARSLKFRI